MEPKVETWRVLKEQGAFCSISLTLNDHQRSKKQFARCVFHAQIDAPREFGGRCAKEWTQHEAVLSSQALSRRSRGSSLSQFLLIDDVTVEKLGECGRGKSLSVSVCEHPIRVEQGRGKTCRRELHCPVTTDSLLKLV